jgi:hypothetical protein
MTNLRRRVDRRTARRLSHLATDRVIYETFEPRMLLAAALSNAIPTTITPGSVPQELFAPGVNNYSLSITNTSVFSSSFRFVLNNAQAGQNITFRTDGADILGPDAAIAIFDSSGNRIALQDSDLPNAGDETLNTTLESGTEYVVGFYGRRVFGPNTGIALSIDTGAQQLGDSLRLNPATNSATLATSGAPNAFTSSKNVRYFPLDLINAASGAQVDLSALGPDSSVTASVFLQTAPGTWVKQSTAVSNPGGNATLSVSPPSGQNVTDGTYMLAVSPRDFTAASQPVTITASTFSGITSASVSPASATAMSTPALTTSGTITATVSDGIVGNGKLYSIIPSVSGPMQVDLTISGNAPRLTVYGPGGASIIDQATRTNVAPVSLTFNATAGTQYFILSSIDAGGFGIPFTLTTTQTLLAADVAVGTTLSQQSGLPIAAGGKLFKLTSPAASRFVAIQLAPDAGSSLQAKLELFGATGSVLTFTSGGAGQPVTALIDTAANAGPYTVFASSTAGTGTASLKYIALSIPASVSLASLTPQTLTLSTGAISSAVFPTVTGQPVGIQYYQPVNGANAAPTTYSAISSNGASAVLLHYVQDGSVLRLMDTAAPTAAGTASVSVPARAQVVHAVVALPVNFSGTGGVQLTVAGPLPKGIGLDMVPNALPNAPTPAGGYKSTVSVNGARLSSNQQRDLYSTTLPFNLVGSTSTLTYTPAEAGGPLRVTVSVLNASNVVIANATSNAGAGVSVPLTGLTAGQTLRIEVKPVNNINLGTGEYGFSMSVNTTDPRPYLVTQPTFLASNNAGAGPHFPNTPFIPLTLNAQNTGTATGNFTSSTPYANNGSGSIQIFEIDGATANIPYQVTTTAIDSSVNTNFAIFYYNSSTNTYTRVPGTAPSFDYFPGDRSSVDARIVVNNTDIAGIYAEGEFGGPIKIYAVVMNEGGSRGQYRVTVEPAPQIVTGPGNLTPLAQIVPAPRAGATNLGTTLNTVQTTNGASFTVRTPSDMNSNGIGTLTVKTNNFSTGQTISVNVTRNSGPIPIFVGGNSAVVGAGGIANIPLQTQTSDGQISPMLGAGSTYTFTITASSAFPSNGLTNTITVPYATVSGTVPPSSLSTAPIPLTAAYQSQLDRLHPAPNGAITDSVNTVGGAFQTLFSMPKAGSVAFTLNSTSGGAPAVGLYRAGKTPNSPYQDVSVLMHFDNTRTSNNFVINANLPAGTYWLRGQGFDNAAPVGITGTIPAYVTSELSVEPGTGLTTQAEQTIINRGASGNSNGGIVNGFPSSQFISSFFKVTVPANATGAPVTFSLFDRTSTFSAASPVPPVGTASLTIFRFQNNTFTRLSTLENAVTTSTHSATISAGEPAVPGAEYYVGVDFNAFQWAAYGGFNVPVLASGVADFSVQPILLSPNAGQTLVQSAITNASFSASSVAAYTLGLGSSTSQRTIPPLAPFGQLLINVPWQPGAASDVVTVNANPAATLAELSRANNFQSVALSTVNPTAPTVTISLVDANMTGEGTASATTGGGTWGRYVSGVTGQTSTIRFVGGDLDSNLYNIVGVLRTGSDQRYVVNANSIFSAPTSTSTVNIPIDFGNLSGTTTGSPNRLQFYAVDSFGLKTPVFVQTMDVATPGSMLTGGFPAPGISGAGGTITFNRSTRQFKYEFKNNIISINPTVSELLGFDVPFIGDKKNELLVAISGTGTSGLNPIPLIPLALTGQVRLTAVDKEMLNKTYPGNYTSGAVSFTSQVTLDGRSLVPGSASATFVLKDLNLLNFETPTIPLFRFGAPGIAELHAGVKFGLDAKLNAAAKMGFDPLAGSVGGYLGSMGIMSPTFIQPEITGTATVTGEAEVLGFDIAELSGSIGLTITATFGLDNNVPGKIIPFDEAFNHLGLKISGELKYAIKAEAFWVDIYEYEDTIPLGDIVNTIDQGIFLTDPPSFASGKFIPPPARRGGSGEGGATPTIKNGNSLVGAYNVDPHPQLVINNSVLNGIAHSIQVRNVGTAAAPLANLAFTNRTGGTWSPLTTISQTTDVSSPELALTNDGANSPAVVVYGVDKVAGSPATQTLNQRLTNQELRYRYFNGTTWSSEQTITNDSRLDNQHSLAFNASGAGTLAWVSNTSATPISGTGSFDGASNDIKVATWNATTHTWGAPVTLTTGGGSDSMPSTFVDASGKQYVTWINTSGGVSRLMTATNTGGTWTSPAVLGISGLQSGGTFRSVAMGSDGAGRANVIFSYQTEGADGSVSTGLYQRPSTTAGYASTQPAVVISQNANYSGLRTTNSPTGALVAYWQQSDGQSNQIFSTTITNGVATAPTQVSTSQNVARSPSAAIDGDGKIQVMYNDSTLFGDTSNGSPTDPTIGAPVANGVASSSVQALPQLTFVSDLAFPLESAGKAPIGSTITGTAKIANRGLAATSVTITAYNGVPATGTVVGTRTINLAPGATFDVSQNFIAGSGTQTYSLLLTTPVSQAFNTTENVSSVTLRGLADVEAVALDDDNNASPGGSITLFGTVKNNTTSVAPNFVVKLYAGDPNSPQLPLTLVSTQTVSGLAALGTQLLSFPVTLSSGASDNVYTLVVDPDETLEESNELNNRARFEASFRGDPAVATADGSPPVTATLLNSGTSNNVRVDVKVTNVGPIALVNVPVNLSVSRNGGPLESLGQQIIPTLAQGQTQSLAFTVTSRSGDNVYFASIDATAFTADQNLSNNTGSANLVVPGVAALSATGTLSNPTSSAGSPLTLNTAFTNAGLADAFNVPYVVYASLTSGGPSILIGSGNVDLPGLATTNLAINLDTTGLASGNYTFTLRIDPNETIVEDTVADNSLAVTHVIATPLVLNGANHYIKLSTDGVTLQIWNNNTGTGSPAQSLALASIPSLTVTAASGSQNLVVDFTNGNPIPGSTMLFNAPVGGNNSLTVIGTTGANAFNLNGSSITYVNGGISAAIGRANVATVNITGAGGADVINLNYANGNPLPSKLKLDGTFTLNGFQNFNNTTLDLFRSTVYIAYTPGNNPANTIRDYLARGYSNGAWTGVATSTAGSINSSAAGVGTNRSIGYADFADGRGVNLVPDTILLKFTRPGDTDLDSDVDFEDLLSLAQAYNSASSVWDQGDFTYDNVTNFDDLLLLAQNYGQTAVVSRTPTPRASRSLFDRYFSDEVIGELDQAKVFVAKSEKSEK